MKNLVLGVAKGYDRYTLEPFVNSFKKNCQSAELVIFVDEVSYFTCDKLIRAGVQLENFPDVESISNNTRWKIILDFLERHGDDYETIFATDTRDVIFQGDVFAAFDDCKNWLGFATEADDIRGTLTGNKVNYNWLINCFGKAEADKLVDQKVICSGTIVGSSREMKIFCRELWKILEHKTADIFDQAVTNWLVYNGRVPVENIFEINVNSGEIFTAYLYSFKKTLEIRGGMILRGNGGVPEVVHQYDRHENLLRLVDELYRDKNFSFDERFTDTRSLLEQIVCLLCADKISEATRLFLRIFFSTENLCNFPNLLIEIWKVALKKNFSRSIEILELAVQNALRSAEKFSDFQLTNVHENLISSAKNHHAVDPEFKNSFAVGLLKFVENSLATGTPAKHCFKAVKMLEELELPPDENFQRLVDEAKRIFGRDG